MTTIYIVNGIEDNSCDYRNQWTLKAFVNKKRAEEFAINCKAALNEAVKLFQQWSKLNKLDYKLYIKNGEYVPRMPNIDPAPCTISGEDFYGTYEEFKTAIDNAFNIQVRDVCQSLVLNYDTTRYPTCADVFFDSDDIIYTIQELELI